VLFLGITLLGVSLTGFLRLKVNLNGSSTDMTPQGSIEYDNYFTVNELFPNTIDAIGIYVYGGSAINEQNIINIAA